MKAEVGLVRPAAVDVGGEVGGGGAVAGSVEPLGAGGGVTTVDAVGTGGGGGSAMVVGMISSGGSGTGPSAGAWLSGVEAGRTTTRPTTPATTAAAAIAVTIHVRFRDGGRAAVASAARSSIAHSNIGP